MIRFDGSKITEAIYDRIYALEGAEKSIIVELDGKRGLVNNSMGEVIIEPKYIEISSLTPNDYSNGYIVKNEDNKYGVIGANKEKILDFKYDEIAHVTGNGLYVVKDGEEYKIIDKEENIKLDKGFDEVIDINGEDIIVKNNGKFGLIDINGIEKIPAEYDSLTMAFNRNYIAQKDGKYGIVSSSNETHIDFIYKKMTYRVEENFVEAEKENFNTDIIDSEFKIVLEDVIISEVNIDKGYIRVRKGNEYKYYNFKFEEKSAKDVLTANTLFLIKENGKYGYQNKDGQKVVDCIYDDAKEQNEFGYSAIKKDGLWGVLKSDGTVILKPSVNLDNNLIIDFIDTWHLFEDSAINTYTK